MFKHTKKTDASKKGQQKKIVTELSAFKTWINSVKRNSRKVKRGTIMINENKYTQITHEEYYRFQNYFSIKVANNLQHDHETQCYTFRFMVYLLDTKNLIALQQYQIRIDKHEEKSKRTTNLIYVFRNDENIYLAADTDIQIYIRWVQSILFIKSNEFCNVQMIYPGYSQKSFINMLFQFINLTDGMLVKNRVEFRKLDLLLAGMKNIWLNDLIINYYLKLIEKKFDSVFAFESFFWFKLQIAGYDSMARRHISKVDFFSYQKILFPINYKNHWMLVVANLYLKRLEYYDSIEGSIVLYYQQIMKEGLHLIANVYRQLCPNNDVSKYMKGWSTINGKSPYQSNTDDCGVFVCTNAKLVSKNQPLNYSFKHINILRQKILQEILDGALKSESVSLE